MASKWTDVYSGDKFQNAPIKEQEEVRKAYFDKYVLPQIQEKGDNPKVIWNAFSQKYPVKKDWSGEVGMRGATISSETAGKEWQGSTGQFGTTTSKLGKTDYSRVRPEYRESEYPPEYFIDAQGKQILNKQGLPRALQPEEITPEIIKANPYLQQQPSKPSILSALMGTTIQQGITQNPYLSALANISKLRPEQPQPVQPSAGATSDITEDPIVNLVMGAGVGAKLASKAGQSVAQVIKEGVRGAVGDITMGGSDIAIGVAKAIKPKIAKEAAKQAIDESVSFIDNLSRHLNKTDEQRISQEVAQGIDDSLNKMPFNRLTGFKEKLINEGQRVKEFAQHMGLTLKSDLNPYERRKLMLKRQGVRLADTANRIQAIDKDVIKTSKKLDLSDKELQNTVDSYLVARHAPERNAVHGEQATPVTTYEANAIKNKIESLPYGAEVERIAKDIQDFHNETLDILYAEGQPWGVIDKASYDKLKKVYPNHIPLNRITDEDEIVGALTGKGMDVKGSGLKRAYGSTKPINDIMENIYSARSQAIKRIEKNIVDNETYNMVSDYIKSFPKQDLFDVSGGKAIGKSFDGNILYEKVTDPHVLQLQRFGRPVDIKIKDAKLASALRGVNRDQLPGLLRMTGTVTRYMSQLATRYNPEFIVSNKIRDIQEAMVYLASQKNIGLKGAFGSVRRDPASAKAVVDYLSGRNTEGARIYQELRSLGGAGEGIALSTKKQVGESLENIRKLNRNKAYKSFRNVADAIDKWNIVFEDSTRLSAYKQALKNGYSKDRAALIAKEASIDFDQMGTWGPVINSMYMFSNASLQGSAKMLRAMKNPKVASAVVGTIGASVFAVNNYNDQIDPDWRNKVSKWDRLNGLNIVLPSDKFRYFSIPVSWGLKPIKVAMEYASDIAYGKDVDIRDASGKIILALAEGYNPTGGVDISSTLTPSVARPFTDIAFNRTWYGSPIKPEGKSYTPESIKYFTSLEESTIGKGLVGATRKLSDAGIEISPADVNYFLKQSMGGAGRFGQKVFNTVSSIGKDIPSREIPFASRVYREIPEEQFRKEDENITTKLQNIEKESFYQKKSQDKIFKAIEESPSDKNMNIMRQWIRQQPQLKREYLADRFDRFMEIKDVDKKNWRWWLNLNYEPDPKAKALIYYTRWKGLDAQGRKDLQRRLGRLDATQKFNFNNDFWAEFQKLARE